MGTYHIAVLDVGKTNKKILIYDNELRIVEERFTRIPEIEDGDVLLDDMENLKKWILETLSELAPRYNIKVIATSAHGATYSVVNSKGEHVVPQVAYNTDPGEEFHKRFYAHCGDPVELQQSTATPNFNLLINPAKGIYFSQQRYPDQFSSADYILLYAQYFGFWLTGNACTDPTYVGNHTYLWNFKQKDWSDVTKKLGIYSLVPKEFKQPWEPIGTIKPELAKQTGLSPATIVTAGIHDSNASMLPYLVSMDEPFLLNSTGTWCVIMNEKEEVQFDREELGKVVFYNMNAFWKPVKTAIFMGGIEFEHYSNIFHQLHGRTDYPEFDERLFQKIIDERKLFILPSVAKGIGQFPDSEARVVEGDKTYLLEELEKDGMYPDFFNTYEEAFAVLNLSLAVQTKVSFDRAGMVPGTDVFTEGGFSKNDSYNTLMTSFYPDSNFYLTGLKEASAFGAAMTGKVAYEQVDIHALASLITIDKHQVPGNGLTGIEAYLKKFISLI
jgi:sugar (pentulose or hexulose) kinase